MIKNLLRTQTKELLFKEEQWQFIPDSKQYQLLLDPGWRVHPRSRVQLYICQNKHYILLSDSISRNSKGVLTYHSHFPFPGKIKLRS